MSNETPAARNSAETVRRILKGVAIGLVPVLFVGFLLTNPESDMGFGASLTALLERLVLPALGAAVVAVSGLFGMRLLMWAGIVPQSLLARFILGAGLGLGTISLLTLALGCAGHVGWAPSALLLGAMFLVGVFELRSFGDFLRGIGRGRMAPLSLFELLLVILFLLVLVFQLILAFNLPTDYDACEYHMAAPWRWAQLGRIDCVEGNVYANLPMNCEMLYLFSLGLCGGHDANALYLGVHLAVVMNMLIAVLASAAAYVLARRFFTRRAALAGMTLLFAMPWVVVASTINIFNEMLLAVYVALAIYAFLELAETRQMRWAILSATFAGLSAGVKYTALGFFPLTVGIPVVLVLADMPWPKRIGAGFLYVAIVLVVVSPWLVKNYAFTGNPVYPFGYKWFGGRDWSDNLDAKWYQGNLKAAGMEKSGNIFAATWDRVIANKWGSLAIAGLVVLALIAWRERPVLWLLIFLGLWTLFWYFCTHRVDRFWLPFAGVAAALAGRGFEVVRWKHLVWAISAALVAALGWQVYVCGMMCAVYAAPNYDLKTGNEGFLAKRYEIYPLVQFAWDRPGCRVLLVGEARTLYLPYDGDPEKFRYSTVFNREAFGDVAGGYNNPDQAVKGLQAARITTVFVNWAEVGRLRDSYACIGHDGRAMPGPSSLSPTRFPQLLGGIYVPRSSFGGPRFPKAPRIMRGLCEEEMKTLPDGMIAEIYSIERE